MQRVYLCLMPQYLLSAITIVYWVFTHSITLPPAWPSRVIYQVRGSGPGFNARSMQIMSSNGGRRARDTRVSNYLETTSTSHITIITQYYNRASHNHTSLPSSGCWIIRRVRQAKRGISAARKSEAFLCGVLLSCRQKCWSHRRKVFSMFNFVDEISGSVGFFQ